jgi:hypothetical protein
MKWADFLDKFFIKRLLTQSKGKYKILEGLVREYFIITSDAV